MSTWGFSAWFLRFGPKSCPLDSYVSIICLGGPSLRQVSGNGPVFTVGVEHVGWWLFFVFLESWAVSL